MNGRLVRLLRRAYEVLRRPVHGRVTVRRSTVVAVVLLVGGTVLYDNTPSGRVTYVPVEAPASTTTATTRPPTTSTTRPRPTTTTTTPRTVTTAPPSTTTATTVATTTTTTAVAPGSSTSTTAPSSTTSSSTATSGTLPSG